MISWKELKSEKELHSIVEKSNDTPVVIFKHSTNCEISAMVKERLELQWDIPSDAIDVYYLDLLGHRPVSDAIERCFDIPHESPQLLLIRNGRSIYDASHADVDVDRLKRSLANSPTDPSPALAGCK